MGHLWRTTGDIYPCFDCEYDHGDWSSLGVMQILNMRKDIRKYAGPHHWNDPDMMEVGNGMSLNEDRAHFSLWAMVAAPLMAGNDLRSMTEEVRQILTNKKVIAINQDSLGVQGFRYLRTDQVEVWAKPLSGGDLALCILNPGKEQLSYTLNWKDLKIKDPDFDYSYDLSAMYETEDLWTAERSTTRKALHMEIPSHDVVMLRLTPR